MFILFQRRWPCNTHKQMHVPHNHRPLSRSPLRHSPQRVKGITSHSSHEYIYTHTNRTSPLIYHVQCKVSHAPFLSAVTQTKQYHTTRPLHIAFLWSHIQTITNGNQYEPIPSTSRALYNTAFKWPRQVNNMWSQPSTAHIFARKTAHKHTNSAVLSLSHQMCKRKQTIAYYNTVTHCTTLPSVTRSRDAQLLFSLVVSAVGFDGGPTWGLCVGTSLQSRDARRKRSHNKPRLQAVLALDSRCLGD